MLYAIVCKVQCGQNAPQCYRAATGQPALRLGTLARAERMALAQSTNNGPQEHIRTTYLQQSEWPIDRRKTIKGCQHEHIDVQANAGVGVAAAAFGNTATATQLSLSKLFLTKQPSSS